MPVARVEVRPPVEADRGRFVEFFRDDRFMVFSGGALSEARAQARFDRMLVTAARIPFAKQPVIERSSGVIVGYAGVAPFDLAGEQWLEFGYRLAPEARGKGYATEASRALLATAAETFHGEILAIIDPANEASQRVARKLGFRFWKQATIRESVRDLSRLRVG